MRRRERGLDLRDAFINGLTEVLTPPEEDAGIQERRAFYRTEEGIVAFVRDVLGADPTDYQADILRTLVTKRREAIYGPHGLGKTALSSWVVLWAMTCFDDDVKVITTASAWRQLKFFTWPEIRKWAMKADFDKIGVTVRRSKELLELNFKLPGSREAFAVASDNADFIEGAHAKTIVYVFDEAKAIPVDTWDAAEGAFSNAGEGTESQAFALAISTPGETSGRFYDICTQKPGYQDWAVRHVTLEDAILAGRITQDWVNDRKDQWGENSAVFKQRVLGEFDDSGENSVVPLAWVEKAIERWREKEGKGEGLRPSYGVDPAYKGEDKTAIARLRGRVIEQIDALAKQDTMQTAGRVAALVDKETPVAIDIIGVGAGVYDRLRELQYRVIGVNVATKAEHANGKPMTDKSGKQLFVNLRSALWWLVREALDPRGDDPIALPDDAGLIGDLTAPTWTYRSDGKIVVESKDDIRERIGRSPDKADAVALALFAATRQTRTIMV